MIRRKTREIKIGNCTIGGKNPIAVQSMLNTKTTDVDACVKQINELQDAGCKIVRFTVMDMNAVRAIYKIKEKVNIPLVADIHFDYKLAVESAQAGIDKLRINPGNIGDDSKVKAVADVCNRFGIPIRIGVNGGSLEREILKKYGGVVPEALVESAKYHVDLLNKFDFDNIVVSLKCSNVEKCVSAYELFLQMYDYPVHVGITETGNYDMGVVKSAVGVGSLLLKGIGDTIRISLTASPVNEVHVAYDILQSVGLYNERPEIISCPTCGRTNIDVMGLVEKVNNAVGCIHKPIKIAVMGCAVNGPGEAREADIGIAGGIHEGLIFKKGEMLKKVPEDQLLDELLDQINKMTTEK